MVDAKTADQALQTYIRPQTFPVAIRMLRPGEAIPERARRPARDFGKLSMNCQVIDMARRYGWTIALTREDSICSLGITALGFDRPTHLLQLGHPLRGHVHRDQGGRRALRGGGRQVRAGRVPRLCWSRPLDRAAFEPDVVVVYANPAQVMRLTQAALWKSGGRLASSFQGRIVCADIIVTTMQTGAAPGDPPLLGRPDLRADPGPRDGLRDPVGADGRDHRGPRGHAPGRHPLPDHAVHGVRGQAPAEVHGGEPPLGRGAAARAAYTGRDHVVAAYKRSFTDRVPGLPDRRLVRRHARRAVDRGVLHQRRPRPSQAMLNYYERYQPDVVLAYNDLAKEAEATGCRRQVLGLRRPVDREPRPAGGQGRARAAWRSPTPKDGAAARLPRAVRGAGRGEARRRPSGAVAVGPWTIAMLHAEPRGDAARHLRGPAVHPRPHAVRDRVLQALGRRDREDRRSASPSRSRPRRSA